MHEAYASGSLFTLDDALHCVFRPTGSIGPLPEQLISQAIHTTKYPSYNAKAKVLGVMSPSLRANEQILSFVTVHYLQITNLIIETFGSDWADAEYPRYFIMCMACVQHLTRERRRDLS